MGRISDVHPLDVQTNHAWQAELLPLQDAATDNRLQTLRRSGCVFKTLDTLREQLSDLARCRNPQKELSESHVEEQIAEILGDVRFADFGVWVFYPWSGCLVRTLPESLFSELRTDRNRNKISSAEQKLLSEAVIGIAGLSAGMAIATIMAMEGIGRTFRLADFDALSLSNLNRLSACISEIGTNKAILAARRLLEINPYLHLELFCDGVTDNNIETFFGERERLTVLIEECDQLWMKVRLREEAKRRKIPVVMDTSDGGMLDVERFDREPDRELFHGLIGRATSNEIRQLSKEDRIGFVLRIVEPERMSPSAAASLLEIGETLSTWPQLASSVVAGGAVVTGVVRRIILGEFHRSGRYFVDPERIISDTSTSGTNSTTFEPTHGFSSSTPDRPIEGTTASVTQQESEWLIAHASLAPSGGNVQPWYFQADPEGIYGYLDPTRRSPTLDFDFTASLVALGAAAENLLIAAAELGFSAELAERDFESWAKPVFRIHLRREADIVRDPLFSSIARRATNRRNGVREALSDLQNRQLREEANRSGSTLQLLTSETDLAAIAALIGEADQLRFLSQEMHAEVVSELRWTMEEALRTRDGIDPASLELNVTGHAILRLLKNWHVMERLRDTKGGTGLGKNSIRLVQSASAVGLMTMDGFSRRDYFRGGRAVQRVWLKADSLGVWLQPMSVITFLFARCMRGGGIGLPANVNQAIMDLRQRFCCLFTIPDGTAEILLFRVVIGESPTARSLRRDLHDVIRYET